MASRRGRNLAPAKYLTDPGGYISLLDANKHLVVVLQLYGSEGVFALVTTATGPGPLKGRQAAYERN